MNSTHTPAYEYFLRQYHAQGREKLDGYTPAHFDGLTAEERSEVFELLKKSLLDTNDDTAIYGLAYVNPQRAIEVFDEFDKKLATYSVEYPKLYYWLHVLTNSSIFLKKLLECGEYGSYFSKLETISYLEKLPNYCMILQWLKSTFFVQTEPAVIHAAGEELLRRYGIVRNSHQDYSRLINLLTSPNIVERRNGIQYLENSRAIDCIEIADVANSNVATDKPVTKEKISASTENRALPNQACPKTGYWYTPAKQGSRRYFSIGEIMPDFPTSKYGATIWYWDLDQVTK